MPVSSELRRLRRYPIQLPLLHRPKASPSDERNGGWSRNLSEGGACVELARRLQPPMPLHLRLRTDRGIIEAEGKVVWAGEAELAAGGGMPHGVAFTQVAPDQVQTLRDLLVLWRLIRPSGIRHHCELAVTYQPKGQATPLLQGRTQDMSRGGLLLRLPRVESPGTLLDLTVHAPDGPLKAKGAVVWVAPPEGRTPGGPIRHGLRFTNLPWSTTVSLGALLVEPA